MLLLVYKPLIALGPQYISDTFKEYTPSWALRSMASGQLVEHRVQTERGEAAFRCYAACNWNKLPEDLRCAINVAILKSRLKTFLISPMTEL